MKKPEINLYIINSNFEKIAYRLCKKLVKKNYKVLINLKNEKELESIDSFFWTNEKVSFLQHLTSKDKNDFEINPLLLTYGHQTERYISGKYDIVISSPSALLKKLNYCGKFFFFSYIDEKLDYIKQKKKLISKGFSVKIFIETTNFNWKEM